MRKFIFLVESADAHRLTEVITQLRYEYISSGRAQSAYEINNGLCEDFADEVEGRFGKSSDFDIIWADNLSIDGEGETWDVDLLKKYWPKSVPPLDWEIVKDQVPAHCWIVFRDRHYDAECPEGVDNLFDLPLIALGMKNLAKPQRP